MESQRHAIRLFAAPGPEIPTRDLVLFFHRLIQEKALSEVCVDVADYSHVPRGPGVLLICHEAHYAFERVDGKLALRCSTKRGAEGDDRTRIRRVLTKALRLAQLAEAHESLAGRFVLDTSSATFWIEDRLSAPNDESTFAAFAPLLAGVIEDVWGASPVLQRAGTPKELFQIDLTVPVAPSATDLLQRIQPR